MVLFSMLALVSILGMFVTVEGVQMVMLNDPTEQL